MIDYIEGDIFSSPAQVIVNTVNTVGVMGKGLALSFKQRYPEMFEKYKTACEKNHLTIGKLMLFYEPDHWILLFPTKENWRNLSKIEYIEKGLMKFVNTYAEKNITSIAFPRLGCGNGELNWNDVRLVMEKYLKPLPIDVYIYLGMSEENIPEHKEPTKTITWLKENAKDMSFNGLKDEITVVSSLIPYKFYFQNVPYSFQFSNELCLTNLTTNEILSVSEDDFYAVWDYIRKKSVFKAPIETNVKALIFSMLSNLGYLSEIKILDLKSNKMENGYQVNEGSGRVYSLTEDKS